MLSITRQDKWGNEDVRAQTKVQGVVEKADEMKWKKV